LPQTVRALTGRPHADVSRAGADFAIASWFWDVVRCAQGQGPQADLGISPRQRRSHNHNEIGLSLKQQRERCNAVEVWHVDVEHDDVGIDALKLIDGLTPGAQCGDDVKIGLGFDPTREKPPHDNGVVDEHDANAPSGNGRRWSDN
jgi:hypothetical protein